MKELPNNSAVIGTPHLSETPQTRNAIVGRYRKAILRFISGVHHIDLGDDHADVRLGPRAVVGQQSLPHRSVRVDKSGGMTRGKHPILDPGFSDLKF